MFLSSFLSQLMSSMQLKVSKSSWSFVCSLRSFRVYSSVFLLLDICLWSHLFRLLIAETFLIDVAEPDDSAIDTCMIFPVPDLTTVTNTNGAIITPVTKMVTIFSVFQCKRFYKKKCRFQLEKKLNSVLIDQNFIDQFYIVSAKYYNAHTKWCSIQ